MSACEIELLVEDEAWLRELPDLEEIARHAADMAMRAGHPDGGAYEISLMACDDSRIAGLNAMFRGIEKPTNVLSWPSLDLAPETPGDAPRPPPASPDSGPILLGDVAIALQTCAREAKAASKPLKNHVTHLILHGVLHLLGYDHETSEDAERMEGIEREALAKAGIPDPYE